MAYFAVIDGNKVIDAIVADTLETAESVSGKTCIEYTLDNPIAVGASLIDDVWVPASTIVPEVSE
jgi:hypothetical protein